MRFALKPLIRRRRNLADRKAISKALERLDGRALGEDLLQIIKKTVPRSRDKRNRDEVEHTKNMVTIVQALHASRRITDQEYVFYGSSTIEFIHDSRQMAGQYDDELSEIAAAIDAIEKEAGLKPDEYWLRKDAPEEHQKLNDQYEAILEARFIATLYEFGLDDLAKLREHDDEEFDRLRERGRRSVHHKGMDEAALLDIVLRYEDEARRAAKVRAYTAAVTMLGAGLEGLLLLHCLESRAKAKATAESLPRRSRPRTPSDPATWTFENLIHVCLSAGWLPPITTEVATHNPAGLAHLLRAMRNYIHPGRRVRERPWLEAEVGEYKDAEAIYVALISSLPSRSSKKDALAEAQ